ncbi:MAG: aminopeptidase 1 [Spirochaetaceae bacterium]|jgi:aspartyl aminopeptidase|nr:aminopeptidase 1 [Spirochaetaceae bacterium]
MGAEDKQNETKSEGELLREKLFVNKKNSWEDVQPDELAAIRRFAEDYKDFLNRGKTERECTVGVQNLLRARGFLDIDEAAGKGPLLPGARVYRNNRGKSLVCGIIGRAPLSGGVNIIGAHIDSPRIDLKDNPLYEEGEFALFDTHYYGGIKNYQWTTIPLALHGVVIGPEGKPVEIRLGEDEGEPVFTITDLLPHLAREQMQKKASEFFTGEDLDILAGSQPFRDSKVKDKVKLNLLRLLHEQYGIVEQDFAGAEFEFVPAHKARDIGFDRSMIGAYGHDDRACAYAALRAILGIAAPGSLNGRDNGEADGKADDSGGLPPEKTVVCLLSDKEETGSAGNTGAQSRLLENFIAWLCHATGEAPSDSGFRRILENSNMLSADVNSAYDPNYDSVYDKKNASFFGKGLVLSKATGSGGKFGGSEANAEFYRKLRDILDKNKVPWQYGDLGKVDKGGGGTIAKYAANLGIEVLDCGVPVLSMHSPFEVISKIDLYNTWRGYLAFLREA